MNKNKITLENITKQYETIDTMTPEVLDKLKTYYNSSWGFGTRIETRDKIYGTTKEYQVVVAMRHRDEWSDESGGTAWSQWLGIYFTKKGSNELYNFGTETIATRDSYSPSKDRRDLWDYCYAGLEVQEKNKIKVYWKSEDDRKGPTYEFNLDEEIEKIQKKEKSKK